MFPSGLFSTLHKQAFTETSERVLQSVVDDLKLPFTLADWQVDFYLFMVAGHLR